jgi:hypothetical protein
MRNLANLWRRLATNIYIQFFGALASIVGFFAIVYDRVSFSRNDLLELVIGLIVGLIILGINIFSFRMWQENSALKRAVYTVHTVNHHYRDTLCQMFGGKEPITDPSCLLHKNSRPSSWFALRSREYITRSFMPTAWSP